MLPKGTEIDGVPMERNMFLLNREDIDDINLMDGQLKNCMAAMTDCFDDKCECPPVQSKNHYVIDWLGNWGVLAGGVAIGCLFFTGGLIVGLSL